MTTVSEVANAAAPVEVLSNASVVELKQLGLGDNLIIEKIKTLKCAFNLTIDGLKELKSANIPDSILSAMLAANQPVPLPEVRPEPATPKSASENRPLPEFYGLYAITENGLVE